MSLVITILLQAEIKFFSFFFYITTSKFRVNAAVFIIGLGPRAILEIMRS